MDTLLLIVVVVMGFAILESNHRIHKHLHTIEKHLTGSVEGGE